MRRPELSRQLELLCALADPVRRRLYFYVSEQASPVTRDQAASALGLGRGIAGYHLNELAEAGLIRAHFERLTARRGPGAGRPSKLYGRSKREFQLSLPERRYELAATLMAESTERLEGGGQDVLQKAAFDSGVREGQEKAASKDSAKGPTDRVMSALESYGFEPTTVGDVIRLRNCPFGALAERFRQVICGMNLSFLRGLLAGLGASALEPVSEPLPETCCVAFYQAGPRAPSRVKQSVPGRSA